MKKAFLLILAMTVLPACTHGGKPRIKNFDSPLCGAVNGFTLSYFIYGEGKMLMIPISRVKENTVFVVGLRPLDGFEDSAVTVEQTDGKLPKWIPGTTKKYSELPKGLYPQGAFEVGCAPDTSEVPDPTKFKVDVVKSTVDYTIRNSLDPRAEVVK